MWIWPSWALVNRIGRRRAQPLPTRVAKYPAGNLRSVATLWSCFNRSVSLLTGWSSVSPEVVWIAPTFASSTASQGRWGLRGAAAAVGFDNELLRADGG